MRLYQIIIFLTLLLCSHQLVLCQDSKEKEYLYVDSSLLNPPDTDTQVVEAPEAEDMGYEAADDYNEKKISYYIDTSLVNNELRLSYDSITSLKNAKEFWYAKKMDSLLKAAQNQQQKPSEAQSVSWLAKILSSDLTKLIFWALAIFFIVFIISKLFITQGIFQRNSTRSPVNVHAETNEEPANAQDFEKKAANAATAKNFRLATRYLYLQSLHLLADTGAVTLAVDKTNAQYLYELAGKQYTQRFASLTLNYEYIWYGEFGIDEAAFNKLNQQFKSFNNELKRG